MFDQSEPTPTQGFLEAADRYITMQEMAEEQLFSYCERNPERVQSIKDEAESYQLEDNTSLWQLLYQQVQTHWQREQKLHERNGKHLPDLSTLKSEEVDALKINELFLVLDELVDESDIELALAEEEMLYDSDTDYHESTDPEQREKNMRQQKGERIEDLLEGEYRDLTKWLKDVRTIEEVEARAPKLVSFWRTYNKFLDNQHARMDASRSDSGLHTN